MKAVKNTKITGLEVWDGLGYFDIECAKFGKMLFTFDIDFNVNRDNEFDSVDVQISSFEWETDNEQRNKFKNLKLNNRNTKLICEYIESVITDDPNAYGFDSENFSDEYEPDFETFYYGSRM
jgi:hypothetical protein